MLCSFDKKESYVAHIRTMLIKGNNKKDKNYIENKINEIKK